MPIIGNKRGVGESVGNPPKRPRPAPPPIPKPFLKIVGDKLQCIKTQPIPQDSYLRIGLPEDLVKAISALLFGKVDLSTCLEDKHAKLGLGRSVLYIMAEKGHVDAVKVLIQYGLDIEAKDEDGSSPLMAARYKRHKDVIHLLLESGASIEPSTALKRL